MFNHLNIQQLDWCSQRSWQASRQWRDLGALRPARGFPADPLVQMNKGLIQLLKP